MRGDEGISQPTADPVQCLELFAGYVCSLGDSFHRLLCSVLGELTECLRCGLKAACAALAKLSMEVAVQSAYYRLMGVSVEEAVRRISVRSRAAASFTASMIKSLRGVHGQRKKWILNTYLKVASYVHPSTKLHKAGSTVALPSELLLQVLDVIAYLESIAGRPVDLEYASRCDLEKTLRLLSRRGSLEGPESARSSSPS